MITLCPHTFPERTAEFVRPVWTVTNLPQHRRPREGEHERKERKKRRRTRNSAGWTGLKKGRGRRFTSAKNSCWRRYAHEERRAGSKDSIVFNCRSLALLPSYPHTAQTCLQKMQNYCVRGSELPEARPAAVQRETASAPESCATSAPPAISVRTTSTQNKLTATGERGRRYRRK